MSIDQKLLERLKNLTPIEKNHYIQDNMGQVEFPTIQFLKCIWNRKYMSFWQNFVKILYGQNGSDRIVHIASWSEFARNIVKFNMNRTICDFDKDWPKFTK